MAIGPMSQPMTRKRVVDKSRVSQLRSTRTSCQLNCQLANRNTPSRELAFLLADEGPIPASAAIPNSIMRVGILSPTQPLGTPYCQAARFVSKKEAIKFLSQSLIVEVIANRLYRELAFEVSGRAMPSITAKQYAKPAVTSCIVNMPMPEDPVNGNLDLAYPEPMRVTVHHIHPGFYRGKD